MRAAEGCTDVKNAVVGASRWRGRATGANATTKGGAEAEKAGGSGAAGGWARAAQLAEPERRLTAERCQSGSSVDL